jgi:hypothetical protein
MKRSSFPFCPLGISYSFALLYIYIYIDASLLISVIFSACLFVGDSIHAISSFILVVLAFQRFGYFHPFLSYLITVLLVMVVVVGFFVPAFGRVHSVGSRKIPVV